MTLPRPRRQQPSLGRRPDHWSDMLRGAAVAVVLIGTLGSALAAKGWHQTIARQRDDRLDRAASSRTAMIEG